MRTNMPYNPFKNFLNQPIFKLDRADIKIGYLNINCLTDDQHSEYVNADRNLLNLDLLCLSDIRLSTTSDVERVRVTMRNWKIVFHCDTTDNKRHMGLLLLTPRHI